MSGKVDGKVVNWTEELVGEKTSRDITVVLFKVTVDVREKPEDQEEVHEIPIKVLKTGSTEKIFEANKRRNILNAIRGIRVVKKDLKPPPRFEYDEEELNSQGSHLWNFYQRWKDFHRLDIDDRENETKELQLKRFKQFKRCARYIYNYNKFFQGQRNDHGFQSNMYDYVQLAPTIKNASSISAIKRRMKQYRRFEYDEEELNSQDDDLWKLYQRWKDAYQMGSEELNKLELKGFRLFKECARHIYKHNKTSKNNHQRLPSDLFHWSPQDNDEVTLPRRVRVFRSKNKLNVSCPLN